MMKTVKSGWPLAVALTVIVGIILAIERPFLGGEANVTDEPIVVRNPDAGDQGLPSRDELAALLGSPTPKPTRQRADGPLAPEVGGIVAWINSEPLTLEELRGSVVLVDFWTYTCVNCIRTFPFLKLWHSRYADDGLVILGIHAPEFNFEKKLDNVVEATQEHGIAWPVALDNNFVTWRNYSNRYWPAKYLVDQDGVIRYKHFGEGSYAETEEKIRELLEEAGADLSDDDLTLPSDQSLDPVFLDTPAAEVTKELYAGYKRAFNYALRRGDGYNVQDEYYLGRDAVIEAEAPEELLPHYIYFNGSWFIGPESARHAQVTSEYEDYIALVYSARSVNAVLTSESEEPYKVRVTMEGEYLTEENKGADVMIGQNGESFFLVTEPRLYNLVENPSYAHRKALRMSSNSDDFGLFAFTFGVYETGP